MSIVDSKERIPAGYVSEGTYKGIHRVVPYVHCMRERCENVGVLNGDHEIPYTWISISLCGGSVHAYYCSAHCAALSVRSVEKNYL